MIQFSLAQEAYGIENLNDDFKRIIIDEGHFTEALYPFKIKPNFATLGSNIELFPQGPINSFAADYNNRDLLGRNYIISRIQFIT